MPAILGTRIGRRIKVASNGNGDADGVDLADRETGFAARWSGFVARRPLPVAIAALAVLIALAFPALHMRLATSDTSTYKKDDTARVAHDLLKDGFGPGFSAPLLIAVELPKVATKRPWRRSVTHCASRTESLRCSRRSSTRPAIPRRDKLPLFIGVVVGLSLLLLGVVFRSVLIPIKAGIFNLLSIAGAFGVVTLIFQDGNFAGLFGGATGPIESFLPIMVFAVVFGLSMDYEVFLVSRMHEEWVHRDRQRTGAGDDGSRVRLGDLHRRVHHPIAAPASRHAPRRTGDVVDAGMARQAPAALPHRAPGRGRRRSARGDSRARGRLAC